MLEVCLLGTGGMMPLPKRWLTSLMVRYNGKNILIDCGEGTQVAMKEKGWSPKPIDVICFTHFHADHISGLPGLFLTMGNAEKTTPLTIIGPRGVEKVVNALRVIAPEIPFPIEFIEITEPEMGIDIAGVRIDAFKVNHNTICYGYSLSVSRGGKFDADKARELNIPVKLWNPLQKGFEQEYEGRLYTPDMVVGPARKGLKVTYVTDTRPCDNIVKYADKSDLFICEGMYGEDEMLSKAKEHKHMTFREAANLAAKSDVKEMWLTHYSPSLIRPKDFVGVAKSVFPNTRACKDGDSVDLCFEDEE